MYPRYVAMDPTRKRVRKYGYITTPSLSTRVTDQASGNFLLLLWNYNTFEVVTTGRLQISLYSLHRLQEDVNAVEYSIITLK